MDVRNNKIVSLKGPEHEKGLRETFVRSLAEAEKAGRISKEDHSRMLTNGPPVFSEGDIIEIKGYRFRIGRIDTRKMILRPVRV